MDTELVYDLPRSAYWLQPSSHPLIDSLVAIFKALLGKIFAVAGRKPSTDLRKLWNVMGQARTAPDDGCDGLQEARVAVPKDNQSAGLSTVWRTYLMDSMRPKRVCKRVRYISMISMVSIR